MRNDYIDNTKKFLKAFSDVSTLKFVEWKWKEQWIFWSKEIAIKLAQRINPEFEVFCIKKLRELFEYWTTSLNPKISFLAKYDARREDMFLINVDRAEWFLWEHYPELLESIYEKYTREWYKPLLVHLPVWKTKYMYVDQLENIVTTITNDYVNFRALFWNSRYKWIMSEEQIALL